MGLYRPASSGLLRLRLYKQDWYLYRALHTIATGRCVPRLSPAWVAPSASLLPPLLPFLPCPHQSYCDSASRGHSQLMPVNRLLHRDGPRPWTTARTGKKSAIKTRAASDSNIATRAISHSTGFASRLVSSRLALHHITSHRPASSRIAFAWPCIAFPRLCLALLALSIYWCLLLESSAFLPVFACIGWSC